MRFNLSEWALRHRSFVVYCMIALMVVGVMSYYRLGRNEDPVFTFRTMVVQAAWPGATLQETLDLVTERIEDTLKETPRLDFLRSYTSAGVTTIFVTLKGSTPPREVPDIWYHVRKSVGDIRHTLPAGVVGPGFNDEFGDTFGIIYGFTADGFTHHELRDYVENIRARLLRVTDVSKVEIMGAQDEKIIIEFSTEKLAGLGIDRGDLIAALRAQNAVNPAGILQTGDERLALRVSGAFGSELDILAINIASNGRLLRLGDIADVRRAYVDPPQPMFRVNGKPAIGVAIAMRDGGDILTLGRNLQRTMDEITADLPLGIEPTLVADQSSVVRSAIGEFMTSLWQAIAIIMAVSVVSLGVRAGAIVALSIPLTLAIVFPVMQFVSIDLQRISLGALIIALTLLVDDAMSTIDAMTMRLAQGDEKEQAATFAYRTLAFPMLTGSLVTMAGFVPIGFARSAAGEYTFSIFAVVSIAVLVLAGCGDLHPAFRRRVPVETGGGATDRARSCRTHFPRHSARRHAKALDHHPGNARLLRPFAARPSSRPTPVLPVVRPAGAAGRSEAAAKCFDLRQQRSVDQGRRHPESRPRRRTMERVCRPRRNPLLPPAQRRAAQRLLQPVRRHRQGHRRPRAASHQAGASAAGGISGRGHANRPARARAASRLAGAVSDQRPRRERGTRYRVAPGADRGVRCPHASDQL